jgi:DnaJ-class molecular chaperone
MKDEYTPCVCCNGRGFHGDCGTACKKCSGTGLIKMMGPYEYA